jgi:hypothetical protein
LKVTNHAKIRWYERFINYGNIDGRQLTGEIKYNFSEAKFYKRQKDGISIYKSDVAYFVIDDNEKTIITVYPINEVIEDIIIKKPNIIEEQSKEILTLNETLEVQVYKKVLNGELPKFPQYFWQNDIGGDSYIGASECTKYMYENILSWNYGEIITKSIKDIFIKNKLNGMVSVLFNGSWHMAIYNAYPDIKPYMIKSRGDINIYWREDGIKKAKEMGIWLIEELKNKGYRFTSKNILSLKWDKLIKEYKLQSLINIVFNGNLAKFFNIVFDANVMEEDIIRYDLDNYFERNKYRRTHI